jgi:nucleotide-binding universal stress UspA family protein
MLRKFVVPLDGSELAERALPYAVRLARAGQGRIILIRVALAPPSMTIDGAGWERDQREAVDAAEHYLAALVEKLADQVPVDTAVPYGRAAVQILDQVRHLEADGIVIATHGRTGLAHLMHGSVAETVLAESDVPVFLVHARPGQPAEPAFDPLASRLMVPLDGSTFAEAAVELAFDFLGPAGELLLVSIVQAPDQSLQDERGRVLAYLDQEVEDRTREARTYLEGVARRLRQKDPDLHVSVDVRLGDPDTGIIAAATDRVVDLIIMATHGRSGLRRITMGNVAGNVLRKGNTPLLLVRPVMPHQPESLPAEETEVPDVSAPFDTIDAGPIAGVEIGMPVVDVDGSKLGIVEYLDMSDPDAVTTEGNRLIPPRGWARYMASAWAGGNTLEPLVPEPLRTRLMRIGYIKLAAPGVLRRHRYVRADRIARVREGRVELTVRATDVAHED